MADDPCWPRDPVDPATAAALAPVLIRGALDRGAASAEAFCAAGDVRRTTARLQAALQEEASAEARALHTEQHFRAASDQLVRTAEAAVAVVSVAPEDPNRVAAAQALQAGLEAWLNPYAGEAAGTAERAAWTEALEALPAALDPALEPVRAAMGQAGARGEAWDAALAARAAAITHRDAVWRAWQAALEDLVAAVGAGSWLEPLRDAGRPRSPEDHWFSSEE